MLYSVGEEESYMNMNNKCYTKGVSIEKKYLAILYTRRIKVMKKYVYGSFLLVLTLQRQFNAFIPIQQCYSYSRQFQCSR